MRLSPAEREAFGREQVLKALESVLPHVHGNPYIPHWPTPPQAIFLGLHMVGGADTDEVFQGLYGGAAGGGKSDCLLMAAAQYAWKEKDFAGICFRRTHTDLAQPGALMDRAMSWWIPAGVAWDGSNKIFRFPSGAKVAMAYLSGPNDHLRYQSAQYQLTCWDELTQWKTPNQYEYVGLSRVRRLLGSKIPLRTLAASNPGGPGHEWVRRKFIGGVDPQTGLLTSAECRYVPARIQDNPFIDQVAYMRSLMHLHPTLRAQLINGDWTARDSGDYFRAEWFGALLDPEKDKWPARDTMRIRWWDLAASEKENAARTAGVLMARHRAGVRAIEHARAFRATPGKRDDLIVQQAQADGHGVVVGVEIEGGSGGIAQFMALEKRLKAQGFRVAGARPQADRNMVEGRLVIRQPSAMSGKEARADPVASCLERGAQRRGETQNTGAPWHGADEHLPAHAQRDGLRLFSGPWVQDFLSEIENFPDGATCDLVDAMSGAWAWLEAHPFGYRVPLDVENKRELDGDDVHPDDRADRAPRWLRP